MEDICPFCKNKFGIGYTGTNNCDNCKISVGSYISIMNDNEIYTLSHDNNKCTLSYNPVYYNTNDTVMQFDESDVFDIFKYNSKTDFINNIKKIMVFA